MRPFEYILSYPSKTHGGKVPLIVLPHGGPHSVFAADWKLSVAFLNSLGYAVCQGASRMDCRVVVCGLYCVCSLSVRPGPPRPAVNYRGSTGFGKKPLEALLGHIGTMVRAHWLYCIAW
jgi:acylaminoacyl-peptidase